MRSAVITRRAVSPVCFTGAVSWKERRPAGVGPIEGGFDGFTTSIEIPLDEDGYLGRQCPSCERYFKMHGEEYEALPEELHLTCPYCGEVQDHSEFISQDQHDRVMAAAQGIAHRYVHEAFNDAMTSAFSGPRSRSRPRESGMGIDISVSYMPGSPPPIQELPPIVEAETQRVIACRGCGNHYAVYGASAFCPVCGPRPAIESVLAGIDQGRQALALEDHLEADQRDNLRAAGVFDGFAADQVKLVVTLFEIFADEQFKTRVSNHQWATQGKGKVFQRLDDADALFAEHAGFALRELVGEPVWERLKRTFEQRHVLIHRHGIVDQRYRDRVPETRLRIGQRLLVSRDEAERALGDLEAMIEALSTR